MELHVQDSQETRIFYGIPVGTAFKYKDRIHIKVSKKCSFYALQLPEGIIVDIEPHEDVEVFSECHVTVVR